LDLAVELLQDCPANAMIAIEIIRALSQVADFALGDEQFANLLGLLGHEDLPLCLRAGDLIDHLLQFPFAEAFLPHVIEVCCCLARTSRRSLGMNLIDVCCVRFPAKLRVFGEVILEMLQVHLDEDSFCTMALFTIWQDPGLLPLFLEYLHANPNAVWPSFANLCLHFDVIHLLPWLVENVDEPGGLLASMSAAIEDDVSLAARIPLFEFGSIPAPEIMNFLTIVIDTVCEEQQAEWITIGFAWITAVFDDLCAGSDFCESLSAFLSRVAAAFPKAFTAHLGDSAAGLHGIVERLLCLRETQVEMELILHALA
jgi:hypothetical protein